MKLSDKIAQAHGKGAPWYSHARQIEAQLEVERGERDDLAQISERQAQQIGNMKIALEQAQADVLKARAAPRLADLRPSFEVDRPVLFILAEVMARAGMREVEVDPAQAERRHDSATVEVNRNIYKATTTLTLRYPCTCNTASFCHQHGTPHEQPADAPDLVTRYQRLVSKAFDQLGGDILDEDDPAHFWLDRLESLLFKHLIPAWLRLHKQATCPCGAPLVSSEDHARGTCSACGNQPPVDFKLGKVLLVEYPEGKGPDPAIVIGAPDTPCAPERDGKHEWYSDGKGGAFCRRCGLQTVQKQQVMKHDPGPTAERCTVCKRNFVDSSSGFDTCDACRKGV